MARKRIAVAGAWLVVVIVGAAIFYHLRHQPFYFDARGYVDAAEGIRANGLLQDWPWAKVRTYGYPWVLSAALSVAHSLHVVPVAAIFGLQWTLFVGTAWLAATSLFGSPRTRLLAFVAVAANPLLVVYTAQALTEALTLPCILLATAALGRAVRAKSGTTAAAWLATGALASGFSLAVRPGNVLIPICYVAAAFGALIWTRDRRSWFLVSASAVLVLASVALPLAPQAAVNWHNYRVASVLPVTDLAALQSGLGVQNIRYATNVSSCGDPALAFPSPFATRLPVEAARGTIMRFYALDWPDGPETAALHIFSGLDPRPFLTYQVSYGVWYERILQAFTVALLGLACFGIARAPWSRRRITPDVVFLGAATFFSVAILATSQAELRFGVVLVTAVSFLAASGVSRFRRPSLRTSVVASIGFAGVVLVWFVLSDLVLARSAAWIACM